MGMAGERVGESLGEGGAGDGGVAFAEGVGRGLRGGVRGELELLGGWAVYEGGCFLVLGGLGSDVMMFVGSPGRFERFIELDLRETGALCTRIAIANHHGLQGA